LNFLSVYGVIKLECWGYEAEQTYDSRFTHFDTVQKYDGQTDENISLQ